uniref:Uncharacterized protein n=1 Tax=Picea sitchensis TaxID=3332 RepID=A9NMF3_PICSI|nr:unknown [Picea sitchensis]
MKKPKKIYQRFRMGLVFYVDPVQKRNLLMEVMT